jgi:hypothetical protein
MAAALAAAAADFLGGMLLVLSFLLSACLFGCLFFLKAGRIRGEGERKAGRENTAGSARTSRPSRLFFGAD